MLLSEGADVNCNFGNGTTPLSYACKNGASAEDVKVLLANGADVNLANDEGRTALMISCASEIHQIVSLLLAKNPGINAQDCKKNTALILAINFCRAFYAMQSSNASRWIQNKMAITPARKTIIMMLLKAGADVNLQNDFGITALMLASELGDLEVIEELINHGADLSIMDNEGRTALDYVTCPKVKALLLQYERGSRVRNNEFACYVS